MKVAYLSVQTRNKDVNFSGEPEISYAGLSLEEYKAFEPETGNVDLFDRDSVPDLIENLRHANLVVCFNTYCFDVLNKYYDSQFPMYYDFAIFDIFDMVLGDLGERVYLETIAQSVNLTRKVTSGLAYIGLWEKGKIEELKHGIYTDVLILKKVFDRLMTSETWKLTDPRTDNEVFLDVSNWVKVAFDLAKDSFYERVEIALKRIRVNSEGQGRGVLAEEFNNSTINHIVETSDVQSYKDSEGKTRLYVPNVKAQLPF